MTPRKPLLQPLLINTAAGPKSTHLTLETRVSLLTPLCVCVYITNGIFFFCVCGKLKVAPIQHLDLEGFQRKLTQQTANTSLRWRVLITLCN